MAIKTPEELLAYLETGDKPDNPEWKDILESFWSKTEYVPVQQLSAGEQTLECDVTTIWDFSAGANAIVTLDQDTTIQLDNMENGYVGMLLVKQDGTGSHSLALPAGHLVGYNGQGAVTLTPTANAIDILSVYKLSLGYFWVINTNFTAA